MTGKILWFFWCGIRAEVDELLPKVVGYARRQGIIEQDLSHMCSLMESTTCTDTEDDQAHLLRMMFDAERGPSKHYLWLATQLAEQAKRTCRARHPAVDTQSTTSRPHQ
ncbi:hypothetical protein EDD17DRAFT_1162962 [Pisolithus thermaeus]|nr:hypothetical protein EDD17DRAFT_1162962 [Pisolithus thermaeus]